MTKKTNKRFLIGAKITVETDYTVVAETLEEAVQKARTLELTDFIEIHGNHNDSSLNITSVFEEF